MVFVHCKFGAKEEDSVLLLLNLRKLAVNRDLISDDGQVREEGGSLALGLLEG